MLRVGIIGLPNAGKSTLFNALTRTHQANVASYPFCTIEPNVGVIEVPDPRLERLAVIFESRARVPTAIEFSDIAGLVRGASRGEGLGNQFLAHIREADALIEVVRCFEEPNVARVEAGIDPLRDVDTIGTELALADLATVERRKERTGKKAKAGDAQARAEMEALDKLTAVLDEGRPVRAAPLADAERAVVAELFLLTAKPVLYAVNVGEADLAHKSPCAEAVSMRAGAEQSAAVVICAELEAQLTDLEPVEAAEYLEAVGVETPCTVQLIRSAYRMLGLITFFTGNEKELRARAIPQGSTAVRAAGLVHTDFERGFIAAEVAPYEALDAAGSFAKARELGVVRLEGRDYVVHDGDVVLFRAHP